MVFKLCKGLQSYVQITSAVKILKIMIFKIFQSDSILKVLQLMCENNLLYVFIKTLSGFHKTMSKFCKFNF